MYAKTYTHHVNVYASVCVYCFGFFDLCESVRACSKMEKFMRAIKKQKKNK